MAFSLNFINSQETTVEFVNQIGSFALIAETVTEKGWLKTNTVTIFHAAEIDKNGVFVSFWATENQESAEYEFDMAQRNEAIWDFGY